MSQIPPLAISELEDATGLGCLLFRKLNFKIFPYSIVYELSETKNEITIYTIQHLSRKSFYWKDRI